MSLTGLKHAVETQWIGAEMQAIGQSCGRQTVDIDARGFDEGVEDLVESNGFEVVGVSPVDSDTVSIRLMER